jgi:hypothetical protein
MPPVLGQSESGPMEGATMTSFSKKLMAAAAVLVASAGIVSAQTVLNADVPFAFVVNGKAMPAGTYRLAAVRGNAPVFLIDGRDGNRMMALAQKAHEPSRAWQADQQARLVFECGNTCVLRQIWTGDGRPAYDMAAPKAVDINSRIAVVVMRTDKGD